MSNTPSNEDNPADYEAPTLKPDSAFYNSREKSGDSDDYETLLPTPGQFGSSTSGTDKSSYNSSFRRFADYEIISEIARGGMGVVYRARQLSLNRPVALKMILSGQFASGEDVKRFHLEAEAAANLDHPGIVPIYEIGEHQGQHFFSMGFVEGGSLADLLKSGPLAPRDATTLMARTCDAIQYAHERGVIHRDLKPGNILLSSSSSSSGSLKGLGSTTINDVSKKSTLGKPKTNGSVSSSEESNSIAKPDSTLKWIPKVTDFGLAKQMQGNSDLTGTGQVLGTPSYMPPEQADGQLDKVGPLSDVYSLGAILYCLLTGRPPFQSASPMETLMQVLTSDPVPPRQLNPSTPRDLETICLKALHKDPQRRYESAQALSSDLRRWLEGEAIQARPVGRAEKLQLWIRKNRSLSAAIGIAALGCLAAVILLVFNLISRASQVEALRIESDAKTKAIVDAQERRREADLARDSLARTNEKSSHTLYARTISLAYQCWLQNNVTQMEDLLDKTEPRFRNWEWNYLKRLCHSELLTLRGHAGAPTKIRYHRDGKHLISSGSSISDPITYIWNREEGVLENRITKWSAAISPDGTRVAAIDHDTGRIQILDPLTGQQYASFEGHFPNTVSASFSSDGNQLVTTGNDRRIRTWDVRSAKLVADILDENRRVAPQVVFANEDRWILWKTRDGLLKIHDAQSGTSIHEFPVPSFLKDVARVSVSPTNKLIAIAGNGPIHLVNYETGELISELSGHFGVVYGLDFSPNGKFLGSSGQDGTVRIWDVERRREVKRFRGHRIGTIYGVFSVQWSLDGASIASGGMDNSIKLWSCDFATKSIETKPDATNTRQVPVGPLDAFPDPTDEAEFFIGNREMVPQFDISRDQRWIATAGQDDMVRVYDLKTRQLLRALDGKIGNMGAVAFHPNGKRLACGVGGLLDTDGGTIQIWDLENETIVKTFSRNSGPISDLCFNSDGSRLYASVGSQEVSHRGELNCWDVESVQPSTIFSIQDVAAVRDLSLSKDGKWVAVAHYGGGIKLWNAETGEGERVFGPNMAFSSVDISPDSKFLVGGGIGWTVTVFDLESKKERWSEKEHSGAVTGVAFSPDGSRIASCSLDKTTRLWDAATGDVLLALQTDANELYHIAFGNEGSSLISSGEAPYLTLRDASKLANDLQTSSDSPWLEIFEEKFERAELGDAWLILNGSWSIDDGVAHGKMTPVPGTQIAQLVPRLAIPSRVSIEYDAWSPSSVSFDSWVFDYLFQNGVGNVNVAPVSALISANSGQYTSMVRKELGFQFEPNRKYRFKFVRDHGTLRSWIDGQLVLETSLAGDPFFPVALIQGSSSENGKEIYIDNLSIMAPAECQDEIAAIRTAQQLNDRLKLKELVLEAIAKDEALTPEIKKMATQFAMRRAETPAIRQEIVATNVLADIWSPAEFKSVANMLEREVANQSDNWETQMMIAGLLYRAGEYDQVAKKLRVANEIHERLFASSHPVSLAILALNAKALGNKPRAIEAMQRLRDSMRSEQGKSDPLANIWLKFAEKEVGASYSDELALSEDMESIYRITFEPLQNAILRSDLSEYPTIYAPDATLIEGRGAEPGPFDLEFSYGPWFAAESLWYEVKVDVFATLVRKRMDVKLDASATSATATSECVLRRASEVWVWHIQTKLKKEETGWRIHYQRTGAISHRNGDKVLVAKDSDWEVLDEKVRQADEKGDLRQSLYARCEAWRLSELLGASQKVVELPNVSAEDLALHSTLAYLARDSKVMRQFGERAVREKPDVQGASFLRALSVRANSPAAPTELAPGIRIATPSFYKVGNPKDVSIPGRTLATWVPAPSSSLTISLMEKGFEPKDTLESAMTDLKEVFAKTFAATALRFEEVRVGNAKGFMLVLQGPGNGTLMNPKGANRDTVQAWVGVRRGDDMVLFVLSSHKNSFNDRNAELKAIFESVEIK